MGLDRRLVSLDGAGADGEPIATEDDVKRELRRPRTRQVQGRRPPAEEGAPAVRSAQVVPVRDLLAVVLTAVGVVVTGFGADVLWGPGAALLTVGLALLLAGVLLGLG